MRIKECLKKKKKKILIIVKTFLPGFKSGGPIQSINNIVTQLGNKMDFSIYTSDRDESDAFPYPNLKINDWNCVNDVKIFYSSKKYRTHKNQKYLLDQEKYDFIYLNSIFNFDFTIKPLIINTLYFRKQNTVILAPRGVFSPGAFAQKKWKKKIFCFLFKMMKFHKNVIWQASSKFEEIDIKNKMGSNITVKIAPNLSPTLKVKRNLENQKNNNSCLKIVFLSRITPKKNLDYAIGILAKVKAPILFDIYGTISDKKYWMRCQNLIKNLPKNIEVNFLGPVEHSQVYSILSKYNLFFFPTKGENYGHVIYEALVSGLIILLSDQTPWVDIAKEKVGWAFPLKNPEKFVMLVEELALKDNDELNNYVLKAQIYAKKIVLNNKSIHQNEDLFSK